MFSTYANGTVSLIESVSHEQRLFMLNNYATTVDITKHYFTSTF